MREPSWKQEIREALRRPDPSTAWSLEGPNRLVKVVEMERVINCPPIARLRGYVTQERYLFGKTPRDIEIALGLKPNILLRGCRVFRLRKLPGSKEYTDEGTADLPGGMAFIAEDAFEAEAKFEKENQKSYDRSLYARGYYPPGSSLIPQWNVTIEIPVSLILDLLPMFRY